MYIITGVFKLLLYIYFGFIILKFVIRNRFWLTMLIYLQENVYGITEISKMNKILNNGHNSYILIFNYIKCKNVSK